MLSKHNSLLIVSETIKVTGVYHTMKILEVIWP
jgi:hypothetical protein